MADQQLVLRNKMEVEMSRAEELEVRIVLVGKTGSGKSATGNTILGKEAFSSMFDFSSETEECQKESAEFKGKTLAVVDTPGLFDTKRSQEEVKAEIARCVSFAAPGPHVFLIVIRPGRFTKEEQKTVEMIQKIFGKNAAAYTMALFTHGDALKKKKVCIKELIQKNPAVKNFISQCGGGYHVFNNEDEDPSQVRELLEKIDTMVLRNGGSFYNNEMLLEARRAILEAMLDLLQENLQLKMEEIRRRAERHNNFIQAFYTANKAVAAVSMGAGIGACVGAIAGPVGAAAGVLVGATVGGVCAAAIAVRDDCVIQ